MTRKTLRRRVMTMEKQREATVKCKIVCRPRHLPDEVYAAWYAGQTAGVPPGCRVFVVRFLSPDCHA